MKELISHLLKQVAAILEYVIAFMLAIGIILLCLRMVCSLQYIPNLNTYPNYDDLLEVCFNLIIGVELIRMMYSHLRVPYLRFCFLRLQDTSLWTTLPSTAV